MGFEWVPLKNYKRHFICLKCQKGFKRSSEKDMKHPVSTDLSNLMNEYYTSASKQDIVKYIEAAYQKLKIVCPNCRNQMVQVHYDFEVPSQRDNRSWKSLRETMSSKTAINYPSYIQWHHSALGKAAVGSDEFKLLKHNLEKLEACQRAID